MTGVGAMPSAMSRFTEKTAPLVAVRDEDGRTAEACVVDAAFARLSLRFEGPGSPSLSITEPVSLRFSSSGTIEGVEAPGRVIERRELDSARLYVVQVPPEVARQVLQSEGLRSDFRLDTLRLQGVEARLRAAADGWAPVLLKNVSVSGAAVLMTPKAEAELSGLTEAELELTTEHGEAFTFPCRIIQRRLEGPRVHCGLLFDWPAVEDSAETERSLRAWLQQQQVRSRSERARSA